MKWFSFLSLILLFLPTVSADAQILRNPVVTQVIRSPLFHDLVDFGISQIPNIAGLPALSSLDSNARVDSTTKALIHQSTKNLDSARESLTSILNGRKEENQETTDKKTEEVEAPKSPAANDATEKPKFDPLHRLFGINDPRAPRPSESEEAFIKSLKEHLQALLGAGNPEKTSEARRKLMKLLKKPDDAYEATKLVADGDRAMANKQFKEALKAYEDAFKLDSQNAEARLGLLRAASELRTIEQFNTLKELLEDIKNRRSGSANPPVGNAQNPIEGLPKIEIKVPTTAIELPKTGKKDIEITLVDVAPDVLTMKVTGKNNSGAMVLLGVGTIPKNSPKGTLTIFTNDAASEINEINIELTAPVAIAPANTKLKTKILP